jgi:hypothetical protein
VTCTSGMPVAHVVQLSGPDGDDSPSPGTSHTDE